MIVIGYPGVGKSYFTKHHPSDIKVIDLESSCFVKNDDWAKSYVNVAIDLSSQGNCVFISAHNPVRKELISRNRKDVFAIYPSIEFKDKWLENLHDRYKKTKTTEEAGKNYRAWDRAEDYYDKDINGLMEDSKFFRDYYVIDRPYSMTEVIDKFYSEL